MKVYISLTSVNKLCKKFYRKKFVSFNVCEDKIKNI